MTARGWIIVALSAGALLGSSPAVAQTAPARSAASRLELAVALALSGSADLGGSTATLTPNLNNSGFPWFDVSAEFASPAGLEARASYRVVPWLLVGVAGAWSRGDVMVTIGTDSEAGPVTPFSGETLTQGQIELRVDALLTKFRFWGSRAVPYVTAGGGVFRHWHEGNVLLETGQVYDAGGGIRCDVLVRPGSRFSRVGVAADARISYVSGGFHWGNESRSVPTFRVELYTGWGRAGS